LYTDTEILELLDSDNSFDKGFRMLVETYQEKLYWHIRRIVHIHADADDVLQNTFVKVFRHIKGFKGESKLYTWLYRIANNESITFVNNKKKKLNVSDGEAYLDEVVVADRYFDPEDAKVILKKAIEMLPEKQKLIFNLRYYDDMSYKDMSEVLTTSVGALKASYHHAVNKVEKYLLDNYNYSLG